MRAHLSASAATALVLAWQAASSWCLAAESALVPSMVQAGPYGDPLLLLPNAGSGPSLPVLRFQRGSPARSAVSWSLAGVSPDPIRAKATNQRDLDDDDDDEDAPTRPGKLPTSFPRLPDPSPATKRRTLGPHLSPDFSYDASDRASLGVIANSARLDGRTTPSVTLPNTMRLGTSALGARATSAPSQTAKSRDVGLGLSLEYRFGE